jgi:hypothetical protein
LLITKLSNTPEPKPAERASIKLDVVMRRSRHFGERL